MYVVPGCPLFGPGVPANGNASAPPTKISGPLCSGGVSTVLNRVFGGGGAVSFDVSVWLSVFRPFTFK
jgi:hypothetical protein